MKCRHPESVRRRTGQRVECARCGKFAVDSAGALRWVDPQERAAVAAAEAIGKCKLGDGELELATLVKGLPARLTSADREILLAAWSAPVDVETLFKPHTHPREGYSTHEILWLVFHKLLSLWVDGADRVWVRTTALGRACVGPRARKAKGAAA